MSDDAKKRAKARQKALSDLGQKYREEYQALYRQHLEGVGLAPAAPVQVQRVVDTVIAMTRKINEAPSRLDFEVCPHDHKGTVDGVTTCLRCGATRPYFSWQPPE